MKFKENPKIAIAGSVNSSLQILKKLFEYDCYVEAVLGLDPAASGNVSGYQDIKAYGEELGIDSRYFRQINDSEVYNFLKAKEIDLFFVVGLSQLIQEPLLSLAKIANIGFHPTKLPQGRGRGAVAWIILGKAPGAATFFIIDEGMDSGPVIAQEPFEIDEHDYAQDVIDKILIKIDLALDNLLPKIKSGNVKPVFQIDEKASYLGKRKPEDGRINWNQKSDQILKLIRATSKPLPGAFSHYNSEKVIIYRAEIETQITYHGVPGRIFKVENDRILIASGDGAIWITEFEIFDKVNFKVGRDFH